MSEIAADAFRTLGPGAGIPNDFVVPYCTCADEACPLSGGLLTGTTVMCQCHGSRFDITTGAVTHGPATQPLVLYAVREVDGDIRLGL